MDFFYFDTRMTLDLKQQRIIEDMKVKLQILFRIFANISFYRSLVEYLNVIIPPY